LCCNSTRHVDILHLLVENGANLEAQCNNGSRALHRAADNGHLPFIQELISRYHVDINARNNNGRTALFYARMYNEFHSDDDLKNKQAITAFLESNDGIDDDEEEVEEQFEVFEDEIVGVADEIEGAAEEIEGVV
jgi:ankyrin repeat protein